MPRTFLVAVSVLCAAGLAAGYAATQEKKEIPRSAQKDTDSATIRRDVNLVPVDFTVRDAKRRLVTHLTKDQFRVFEEGKEQAIEFFAYRSDVPLNLGVLLDTSTTLGRTLSLEADAASQFLRTVLRTNDLGFVVNFDAHVQTLQVPTAQLALLEEKVNSIRALAKTWDMPRMPPHSGPWPGNIPTIMHPNQREALLYDAVHVSANRYLRREVGRKAVVIVALADDARSESTLEDALLALQQSDAIAYVLQLHDGPDDNCDIMHIFERGKLRKLAEETGGRVIDVQGMNKMQKAFEEIAEELHSQYSLGYTPQNQNWDGRYRRVQIKVRAGGHKVQARKGYFAIPRGKG